MWQGNGRGNYPPFLGNFNPGDNSPSTYSGSSDPHSAGYSFQQQPNQEFNGAGYIDNGFQDFGMYNDEAYMQDQAINAGLQVSCALLRQRS